ncbi:MAG: GNAT family N-acetyltransferase [Bacteroidota bacterium]
MLNGKNIRLRALEPSDIDMLYKWENDPAIWQVSNTLTPYSRFVLEQYIANSHQDIYTAKQLRLVIQLAKDLSCIGCIDIFDFDPRHHRAGIGVLIADEKERQNGYATEALQLLLDYCFKTLQLHQVYCNVSKSNTASLHLFKKHGFEITGTKKDWNRNGTGWEDEYLMQLVK